MSRPSHEQSAGRAWWDRVATADGDPFELDGYGEIARRGGEQMLERIVDDVCVKLDLRRDHELLEVGCGAGAITRGVATRVRSVVAADFSPGMLRRARRLPLPNTRFVAAEAGQLPFGSQTFDRVLCYSVFNNFPSLDYARHALLELIRVAKPGGVVLVGQVPNADRRDAWFAAYHAKFGGRPRSRLRTWAGRTKRGLAAVGRALLRQPRPPALDVRYYAPSFAETTLMRTRHRCEVVPAYDLLGGHADVSSDYRLDVRISVDERA